LRLISTATAAPIMPFSVRAATPGSFAIAQTTVSPARRSASPMMLKLRAIMTATVEPTLLFGDLQMEPSMF
jgi:hypothetical protein